MLQETGSMLKIYDFFPCINSAPALFDKSRFHCFNDISSPPPSPLHSFHHNSNPTAHLAVIWIIIAVFFTQVHISNYIHYKVRWNYLSIPKLQRYRRGSLGMDK